MEHIKVSSVSEAWRAAARIFPTDYEKNEENSKRAGYPIYETTSTDERFSGFHISDLNTRLPGQLEQDRTKVNQCVDNIMQIWRDGEADKLTQLVFCDISTPQAKAPASKAAKTLDNPLLHALEGAVPLPEQEPAFTVYDDIRQKLIAQGMPADQIAFIHEANTEVRKKELFSKVRTGQVRVLLGSTAKMGAGTNVQDRLVALHDLDCPWSCLLYTSDAADE